MAFANGLETSFAKVWKTVRVPSGPPFSLPSWKSFQNPREKELPFAPPSSPTHCADFSCISNKRRHFRCLGMTKTRRLKEGALFRDFFHQFRPSVSVGLFPCPNVCGGDPHPQTISQFRRPRIPCAQGAGHSALLPQAGPRRGTFSAIVDLGIGPTKQSLEIASRGQADLG